MNTALWIGQGVLAAMVLMPGAMKVMQGKKGLMANPMTAWAEDVSHGRIKMIGTLEMLAAIGLVLPWALDIVPIVTPLAAAGIALLMMGAISLHMKRSETKNMMLPAMLLVLAVFVAWGRFADL